MGTSLTDTISTPLHFAHKHNPSHLEAKEAPHSLAMSPLVVPHTLNCSSLCPHCVSVERLMYEYLVPGEEELHVIIFHTHTHTHTHAHTHTHKHTHKHTNTHTQTHTHAHTCTHIHTHTHAHKCMHTHTNTPHKHTHTHTHTHTQMHTPSHKHYTAQEYSSLSTNCYTLWGMGGGGEERSNQSPSPTYPLNTAPAKCPPASMRIVQCCSVFRLRRSSTMSLSSVSACCKGMM